MSHIRPLFLVLLALSLSSCIPVVAAGVVGGGAVTASREKRFGQEVDDYTISTKIHALFVNTDNADLIRGVGIEVDEGRVLLTGEVTYPKSKERATELSWKAEGVREVINEIQVTGRSGLRDYPNDGWITTQVRTNILFDKSVRGVNYSVETVNGTVYLLGVAQNQAELDKVVQIARTTKYVKEVVSHVVLKADSRRKP